MKKFFFFLIFSVWYINYYIEKTKFSFTRWFNYHKYCIYFGFFQYQEVKLFLIFVILLSYVLKRIITKKTKKLILIKSGLDELIICFLFFCYFFDYIDIYTFILFIFICKIKL